MKGEAKTRTLSKTGKGAAPDKHSCKRTACYDFGRELELYPR